MLYFILFLALVAEYIITRSLSAVIFSIVILAIGRLFCSRIKSGKRSDAWTIFVIAFIVYVIIAIIRTLDIAIPETVYDTLFKTGGDEDGFFEKSMIAAQQLSFYEGVININSNLVNSLEFDPVIVLSTPGYNVYIGLIGYLSSHLIDGNCIIVQLLGSVLFGCLLSVQLYKILSLFLLTKRAFHYAIMGSLCTGFTYFSVWLLRDIHITFFFAVVFYNILQPYSRRNLVKLLAILLVTASIRIWSALYMAIFLLFYIYWRYRENKTAVFVLASTAVLLIGIAILPLISDAFDRLLMFSRKTETQIVSESGYLQVLYKLPTPIKELAIIASSYLTPFMSWNDVLLSGNIYHGLFRIIVVVYEFYWFVVIWMTAKWCLFNKKVKQVPHYLIWLLVIVLAYLFVSTSEFSVRRTMCMYPIIYLVYSYLKERHISRKQFKKDLFFPLAFYCLGFIVFVL